jgi:uncharacterized protein (DUF305 family)
MRILRVRRTSVAVVALILASCGGATKGSAPAAPQPAGSGASAAGGVDYDALYRARKDSERQKYTDADVHFMTGMISHHAQALVMAALAPTNGASPAVATLCSRIMNSQSDEIRTMQGWLRDRGLPVPEIHIDGLTLTIDGPMHMMHMPGMLTQAQLEELGRARGPEFDRLFLTYMIQHHKGALVMVRELFATDGGGQGELAFKLANDIQVDQTTEIARMKRMLAALPAGGRTP